MTQTPSTSTSTRTPTRASCTTCEQCIWSAQFRRHTLGIYFIDPEEKEFKETIKNARKKLETSVAPARPCKIMKKNCGSGASNKVKTKLACILEANESTRMRMGNSIPPNHEDHIAGKGEKFITALQFWFTNLFLCLKL